VGSVTLESTGLIPKQGGLRLKDAVEAFLRFTDKPMVAAKEAVTAGLAQACADGLVGVGRGGSPSTLQARYCKEPVSLDPSEDGVWIVPPFTPEPVKVPGVAETAGSRVGTAGSDVTTRAGGSETLTAEKPGTPGTVRRFLVRGAVPVENWGELFRCFVGPAARIVLAPKSSGHVRPDFVRVLTGIRRPLPRPRHRGVGEPLRPSA
jgi:hypothetical protein